MRPRPSHMSLPSGGCLGWSIAGVLSATCWPLALVWLIIFGLWTDADEESKACVLKSIAFVIFGFILIMAPILSVVSLLSPNTTPSSNHWVLWLITIAETIVLVRFLVKNIKRKRDEQDYYFVCPRCGNLQWGYNKRNSCNYCGHDIIRTRIKCSYYITLAEQEQEDLRNRLRNQYVFNNGDFNDSLYRQRKATADTLE